MPFADVCLGDRESCPNEWPVLSFTQDASTEHTVNVRDASGKAILLDGYSVFLIGRESFGNSDLAINIAGTIVDADNGVASFTLPCDSAGTCGIFIGQIVILTDPDAEKYCDSGTKYRLPCYIEVLPNIATSGYWETAGGPLTIAEIRLALRDKCSEDNFLLDNVEFSDTEIAWCIRRPIEFWNETPPPLRPTYTPSTFPYRYHWTTGVIGELLRIAGPHYERNRLRYSAGGLSVDDKDKAGFYIQLGDRYIQEYRDWVIRKKYSINVNNAFGKTDIPAYGNNGYNYGISQY